MNKQNILKTFGIFIIFIIASIFIYTLNSSLVPKTQDQQTTTTGSTDPMKWIDYSNNKYNFSLQYPQEWVHIENTIDTSLRGATQFLPSDLNKFPECKKIADELINSNIEQIKMHDANSSTYTIPSDYASPAIVYNEIKSTSCSIGIRVEENPKQLAIKEYLKDKFLLAKSLDQAAINYIESLSISKINNTEKTYLDKSFYYISGFGEKEGVEPLLPYFSEFNKEHSQFIIARGNIVIFINNNINTQDLLLPINKYIFDKITESIEFI